VEYQLIAIDRAGSRPLGRYHSYRAAAEACDADTVAQLAAGGGWRRRIEHLIVGPGADGEQAGHPQCAELGVARDRGVPPGPEDLREAERWLARIRRARFAEPPDPAAPVSGPDNQRRDPG